jgi:hypothetical protein
MDYEIAEAEIVTKLQPLTTVNIDVAVLPETEDALKKVIQKPKIYVSYNGTDFNIPTGLGRIVHGCKISFEIVVQSTKLRGDSGIYRILNLLKLSLVGFEPTELTKLFLTEEKILSYENGIWNYRQLYTCIANQVEADDGAIDVALTQITNNFTSVTNG